MWFEVLPCFFIITGALAIPQFLPGLVNVVINGNVYRRNLHGEGRKKQYFRDTILGDGNPYAVKGIEAIPDE